MMVPSTPWISTVIFLHAILINTVYASHTYLIYMYVMENIMLYSVNLFTILVIISFNGN